MQPESPFAIRRAADVDSPRSARTRAAEHPLLRDLLSVVSMGALPAGSRAHLAGPESSRSALG